MIIYGMNPVLEAIRSHPQRIALSTPHRADSFEACRWIIDTLKKEVTVWKKEVWTDGSQSWVHPLG